MIVIDDFIKDQELINAVEADKDFFGPNGNYMWWDGWWNSPADTLKAYNKYWTGVYGDGHPNTSLIQHFDKDEAHWEATGGVNGGEIRKPIMGTIYYPKDHSFDGGFLEVYTNGRDKEPERIAAQFNRLIVFEAGDLLHRVTEVTNGVRYALAVNLWQQTPIAVNKGGFTIE